MKLCDESIHRIGMCLLLLAFEWKTQKNAQQSSLEVR